MKQFLGLICGALLSVTALQAACPCPGPCPHPKCISDVQPSETGKQNGVMVENESALNNSEENGFQLAKRRKCGCLKENGEFTV